MTNAVALRPEQQPLTLFARFATRYGVDEDKMLATLKATAFKQRDNTVVSNEQMVALLIVADQYKLNPFTKEIYAYPDKQNGIVPVVGVDGWSRIINEHPALDGIDFRYSEQLETMPKAKACPKWCEVIITRKDRAKPIIVREYLDEVFRDLSYFSPWQTHTKRMLRHKTLIQGARIAFGFAGIYDEDEAERIIDMGAAQVVGDERPAIEQPRAKSAPTEPAATPASVAAPSSPDAESQPAEGSGQAEDKPLTAGAIKTLQNAMAKAGRTEADLAVAGFPAVQKMTFKAHFQKAMDWLKANPAAT